MRFYTQQHVHYCGIDLHARTMQPLRYGPRTSFTKQSRYMVYTSMGLGDLEGGSDALGSNVDHGPETPLHR